MHQLKPNVATFGCLAYKVTNTKLFDEFVNDVHVSIRFLFLFLFVVSTTQLTAFHSLLVM